MVTNEWGGTYKEYGIKRHKLLYIKQINNKDLQYSIRNYTQYLVITYNGIQPQEYSLCCTPEINTTM